MKERFRIGSRATLATVGVLVIAMGAIALRAKADVWDKKTILTVDQPMQVEETYLDPGTYVFKLLNLDNNRHIVQIFDRDQDHLINAVLAIPNYRLRPSGESRFTFYETPPGTARALHAWFYPGDNFGQEFRYPKQLRQIAMATAPTRPASPPEPLPQSIFTAPAAPEPQAAVAPAEREEPEEMARNIAPEPSPAAEPTPSPAPQPMPSAQQPTTEKPQELPKTATPFPLIGLAGLLSLACYGLLRIRRMT